jgi:hypothetical protein
MTRHAVAVAGLLAILTPSALASVPIGADVDYDGDGRVSREEFVNAVARVAHDADANADGQLTPDEYPFTPGDLALFDTNKDGVITSVGVQEFQDRMDETFDALDVNADGYLDPVELQGATGS